MSFIEYVKNLIIFENFIIIESVILMLIFIYYANGKVLKKKTGEYKAYQIHFLSVFILFFLIPLVTLFIFKKNPSDFGLKIGDFRTGALWTLGGIVIAVITGFSSSRMDDMKKQYPFAKSAMDNKKKFILFEFMYLLFYYSGWEFLFRGILLFTLARINPMLGILAQVIPSVLLHIGHPQSETWASVIAGVLFGYLAYTTGSIIYPFIIHASIGISVDIFMYIKHRKA